MLYVANVLKSFVQLIDDTHNFTLNLFTSVHLPLTFDYQCCLLLFDYQDICLSNCPVTPILCKNSYCVHELF